MKTYYYTIVLLFAFILISSCSKDLGNYEYKDINELNIKDVKSEYTARTGIDTLRIRPIMNATMDEADTSRYKHIWILQVGANLRDTIGRKRNLDYAVRLKPADYALFYRVLDSKTGVTWTANTKITVTTSYSRGLLIIGEDEQGNAEAEMLSMLKDKDTIHIKHILSQSGLPVLRDPVSFVHTAGSEDYVKLWAFTRSGSYYLDRSTLTATTNNNFSRMVYMSESLNPETLHPLVIAPQVNTVAGGISGSFYRAMITTGGEVFASIPLFSGGDYFTNPVNRLATAQEVRLPAAPYLIYTTGNFSTFIWYDTKNQRFLNYASGIGTASTLLTDGPNDDFPWNQPSGRTLVYAENTRNSDGGSTNGNSFAIMKNTDNTCLIYKFYASGSNPAKRGAYAVKPIARDFDKAKCYAFSSRRTVVFYVVGNKLYAYDYNPDNEKLYEFPELGNDEISMIKFDTQIDYISNSLYIGTYNSATKGTLRRYLVGTNPNVVELLIQPNSTWQNMVKIKDVNWRAIN